MKDLPLNLISKLKKNFTLTHLTLLADLISSDKSTRKVLFSLPDGSQIESVLMEYHKRHTVCISTQAGCGLGCTFCATGQGGLERNLSAGEIIEQVLFFNKELHKHNEKITNIVYMGMGEPFANYKQVMKSVDILTDEKAFNFGARRITISTVGLIPEMEKFTEEKRQVNLAVSLHAAEDKLRNSLIPVNKKYPIKDLINTCRDYVKKTGRRISFEWALIKGVNDSEEQAELLSKLIKETTCHVNLIPLNNTEKFKGRESSSENIKQFRRVLDKYGIPNTLRIRRGIDIQAGCGQLRQSLLKTSWVRRC